jgi:hypothetical protein
MVYFLKGLLYLNYGYKLLMHKLIKLSFVVVKLKYGQICSIILNEIRIEQC